MVVQKRITQVHRASQGRGNGAHARGNRSQGAQTRGNGIGSRDNVLFISLAWRQQHRVDDVDGVPAHQKVCLSFDRSGDKGRLALERNHRGSAGGDNLHCTDNAGGAILLAGNA